MKFSSAILLAITAMTASASPLVEKSPAELVKDYLEGNLEKRACNYSSCDDCLARQNNCRTCNGPGDHPGACLSCWIFCASNCGC